MILFLFIFKDTLDAHFGRAILRVRSTSSHAGCCAPKSFCRFEFKQRYVIEFPVYWVRNEKMIGKCYVCRTIYVAGTGSGYVPEWFDAFKNLSWLLCPRWVADCSICTRTSISRKIIMFLMLMQLPLCRCDDDYELARFSLRIPLKINPRNQNTHIRERNSINSGCECTQCLVYQKNAGELNWNSGTFSSKAIRI